MKLSSRSLARRVEGLEAVREKQRLGHLKHQRGAVMHIPVMATSVDEWERITTMRQKILKQRSRHEGPEPDEVAFPYPDEVIEHLENQEWEYHA